jgi:hypothetical protein
MAFRADAQLGHTVWAPSLGWQGPAILPAAETAEVLCRVVVTHTCWPFQVVITVSQWRCTRNAAV